MKAFSILIKKDFRSILRSKDFLAASFGFSLLLVLIASFAFRKLGYSEADLRDLTSGILWLVFLFSSLSFLNQSFSFEKENKALSGILMTHVSTDAVYFSKFLVNLCFIFIQQVLIIVIHSLFFGVGLADVFTSLLLVTFVTSVGFVSLGTLLSAISTATDGKEILLPLILFPLSIPLLIAAVFLFNQILTTGTLRVAEFWFVLICVFDIISVACAWMLFEYLIHE